MEVFKRFRPIFERASLVQKLKPEWVASFEQTKELLSPDDERVKHLKQSLSQMHFWQGVLEAWAQELDEFVTDEFLDALAESRYALDQAQKHAPGTNKV